MHSKNFFLLTFYYLFGSLLFEFLEAYEESKVWNFQCIIYDAVWTKQFSKLLKVKQKNDDDAAIMANVVLFGQRFLSNLSDSVCACLLCGASKMLEVNVVRCRRHIASWQWMGRVFLIGAQKCNEHMICILWMKITLFAIRDERRANEKKIHYLVCMLMVQQFAYKRHSNWLFSTSSQSSGSQAALPLPVNDRESISLCLIQQIVCIEIGRAMETTIYNRMLLTLSGGGSPSGCPISSQACAKCFHARPTLWMLVHVTFAITDLQSPNTAQTNRSKKQIMMCAEC